MPLPYLTNALAKAQANFDEENIKVLQQELTLRAGGSDTSVGPDDQGFSDEDTDLPGQGNAEDDDTDESGNYTGGGSGQESEGERM